MVHLNKNKLPEKEMVKILTRFISIISQSNKKENTNLLNILLGEEEKLMLAKRLATIVMIKKDLTDYRISKTLKLSPNTVKAIRDRLNNKGSKQFNLPKNAINDIKFIVSAIESLLTLGGIMPMYNTKEVYQKVKRRF